MYQSMKDLPCQFTIIGDDLSLEMIKFFEQFDNLISAWSAPNPRDAFYLKVFGKTYADQKAHERKMYGSDKEEETLN